MLTVICDVGFWVGSKQLQVQGCSYAGFECRLSERYQSLDLMTHTVAELGRSCGACSRSAWNTLYENQRATPVLVQP
jgi:hypothetical protein